LKDHAAINFLNKIRPENQIAIINIISKLFNSSLLVYWIITISKLNKFSKYNQHDSSIETLQPLAALFTQTISWTTSGNLLATALNRKHTNPSRLNPSKALLLSELILLSSRFSRPRPASPSKIPVPRRVS